MDKKTPAKAKVGTIIGGAIDNALHAHPNFKMDMDLKESIIKRAVGTLTSQWPDVLAISKATVVTIVKKRKKPNNKKRRQHELREMSKPPYHYVLTVLLGYMIEEAKKEGKMEKVEAFIEVVKLLKDSEIAQEKVSTRNEI